MVNKLKKILILGGSSDIGLSIVENLLTNKSNIIYLHYNSSNLKNKKKSKQIKYLKSNFLKEDVNQVINKFDANYDVIVNLTGYLKTQSFENINYNSIIESISINSLIPNLIIKKSLSHMKKQRWGRIINTSSIGTKFGGSKDTYSYSISKYLNEFIPSYIKNLVKYNILYNVVRIGVINTKIHKKINNKNLKKRMSLIPIKRIGQPKEVSNFINFLISEQNTYLSSQVIDLAGGE